MATSDLPSRPSLEQYRKQAKELLKRWKSGDPAALRRVHAHDARPRREPALADAQLVLAREHGFASWPKFTKHLQAVRGATSASAIWRAAERAVVEGDAPALAGLLHDHEDLFRNEEPPPYVPRGPRPDYSALDPRTIIAREHMLESWDAFEARVAARRDDAFEAAVDAVVAGDVAALTKLLREDPELTRARSKRRHRATLLHYVGANGVEGFRQRTPKNAGAIAEALLDAGAEVDAVADIYGGNARALALVATSIHPRLAGVQDELLSLLLDRGASLDRDGSLVNDCLATGRGKAAELLATRGAPLDFAGAAGLGRVDLVRALLPAAREEEVRSGFAWACQFGRTDVVRFLLHSEVDERTGLHWAAYGGHRETVELLLASGAPVDAEDPRWRNTPLGWALHGYREQETDTERPYHEVVAKLVSAGAVVRPAWLEDEKVRADVKMLSALAGE